MPGAGTLEIRLFGTPRFAYGQPIASTLSPKTLAFFAYLLLHRDGAVARETIAFSLWPDETEEGAFANLRRSLYLLQRWLPQGPQWLVADRRSVAWNPEAPYWLDVQEYEHLVGLNRNAEAAKLYGGELLQSIDEEWVIEQRTHYRNQQLRLLESVVAQLRESGDIRGAIAIARQGLQLDPWHEEFVRDLIALRAESGDRAGALGEYRTFEEALKREMGAAPTRDTTVVYERVRSGASSETTRGEIVKRRAPT